MSINDAAKVYRDEIVKPDMPPPSSTSLPYLPHRRSATADGVPNDCGGLKRHQGQKWSHGLDFDKILKQIRNAQKQIMRSRCDIIPATATSKNAAGGQGAPRQQINVRCAHQLRQVNRLHGRDMCFYGVSPKQKALDTIVCSECEGVYTKVGFHIHSRRHHPDMWNKAGEMPKVSPAAREEATDVAATDILSPGVPSTSAAAAAAAAAAATAASVAAAASSSSAHSSGQRHKSGSSKESSKAAGSSSGGSRSKSKSKHKTHHTSHTEVSGGSGKSSKKSSSSSAKERIASPPTSEAGATSSSHHAPASSIGSAVSAKALSSSTNRTSDGGCGSHEKKPSKHHLNAAGAAAAAAVASILPSPTTKRKARGPSINNNSSTGSGQEIALDVGREAKSQKFHHSSSKSNKSSSKSHTSSTYTSATTSKAAALSRKDLEKIESQMSELDQAVSSITGGTHHQDADKSSVDSLDGSFYAAEDVTFKVPKGAVSGLNVTVERGGRDVIMEDLRLPLTVNGLTQSSLKSHLEDHTQASVLDANLDESNNTSDDNGMLSLEDMLDTKFLNEILNNTDEEITFDEQELEEMSEQHYTPQRKRMRYDGEEAAAILMGTDQQELTQEQVVMSDDYTAIYQQQQQQGQLLQQQQQQFSPYTDDVKLFHGDHHQQQQQQQQMVTTVPDPMQSDPMHHAAGVNSEITTIDAVQLQQLLYQQQQGLPATVYDGRVGLVSQASGMEQLPLHVQQQYELCLDEDLQKAKLRDYGSLTEQNNGHCGTMPAAHFNVYNVPSLTDGEVLIKEEEEEEVAEQSLQHGEDKMTESHYLPDISMMDDDGEGPGVSVLQHNTPQYALSTDGEEQLIYEINDNNQVTLMSQQRQQQVLAQLLNNVSCEPAMKADSVAGSSEQLHVNGSDITYTASGPRPPWDDPNDLCDFDFNKIETASSPTPFDGKQIKSETASFSPHVTNKYNKLVDDVCSNVYSYAGLPRPLTINSFGMVKLPHIGAVTFRKQLLTTRKANNSPMSLSSGAGVAIGNISSSKRYVGCKPSSSCFSTLPVGSQAAGNEFNIGNITITNNSPSPSRSASGSSLQRQYSVSTSTSSDSGGTSPIHLENCPSTSRSARLKLSSVGGSGSGSKSKVQLGAGVSSAVSSRSFGGGSNSGGGGGYYGGKSSKTIYVSGPNESAAKLIQRSPIAKAELPPNWSSIGPKPFTSKHIADIINSSGKTLPKFQHRESRLHDQHLKADDTASSGEDILMDSHCVDACGRFTLSRVHHFYEHRKKLLDSVNNAQEQQQHIRQNILNKHQHQSQMTIQQQQQQQQPQPQQQQLYKTFTDCGVNSAAYCKSNSNATATTNGNDVMHVFV